MEINENYNPDTAIIGLWFGLNYGSVLSAYALYKTVEEMGYKPVFLNKPVGFWGEKFDDPDNAAGRFIHRHCYVSEKFYDGKTLFEFTSGRKNFIAGSDIIWNYDICGKGAGGFFFLDFVPDYKNKISYASGFGSKFEAPGYIRKKTEELLKRIPSRSVGDDRSVEIMNLQFQMDAELVLDPIFLTDQYDLGGIVREGDYIFTYMENCDAQKRKMIRRAMDVQGRRNVNFADLNQYEASAKKFEMDVEEPVSVEDWTAAIKNAAYVITDSYYAMCMAIKFHKPFLVLEPKGMTGLSRYMGLLEGLGLQERMVYVEEDMNDFSYLLRKPVKYTVVNERLEARRKASFDWLFSRLGNGNEGERDGEKIY